MTDQPASATGFSDSWYHHTATPYDAHAPLQSSIESDVCVIGAGYTGLSAALELSRRDYNVVLLEAHRVGAGASGRNGGVLGSGQRVDQLQLEAWLGQATARRLWRIAYDANQLVRDRITHYHINCDLRDGELTVAHRARHEAALWANAKKLKQDYDHPDIHPVDRHEVADMLDTDAYFGGHIDRRAGHLHPLNLALGLARAVTTEGGRIFEQSEVTSYTQQPGRVQVTTRHGHVNCRYLVIACNGYLDDLAPSAARWQMPINNFILATAPLGEALGRRINRDNLAVVDTRFVVNYFHNSPDHRLIFGGGENYSSRFPHDIKTFVRKHMLRVYPQLRDIEIDFGWGGTLAITLRRMPHFGHIDHQVYWAQGYSGHGIAMANMGGKLVAEALMGQAEDFDLFARLPHLPFPGGKLLRWPALVAGMLYYSLLDRF